MRKVTLSIIAIAMLASCAEQAKEEVKAEPEAAPEVKETCVYAYDHSATELIWTAYKFNQRTGVKGGFDEITVTGTSESEDPSATLLNADIVINTASVNSGDATRDPKIIEHFFGGIEGGAEIKVHIKEFTDASIAAEITLNGKTVPSLGTVSIDGENVEAKLELNMVEWDAQSAIDALNTECKDLHTGSDGESILWPEVTVLITTTLSKSCE